MSHSTLKETDNPLVSPTEALALLNTETTENVVDSPQDLDESAQEDSSLRTFFGINLGAIGLLLDEGVDKEMVDNLECCPVPNSPSWLKGFTNVRGQITPVFDLNDFLQLDQEKSDQLEGEYLLVIGKGVSSFAINLTDFPEKLALGEQQHNSNTDVVPKVLQPHVRQVYFQDRLWCEWDYLGFMTMLKERLAQ